MMFFEFEVFFDFFNDVMDFIIEEDVKFQWVCYLKRMNFVVIRVLIFVEVIEQFFFRFVRVVGIFFEVIIVEEKIGEKLIYEVFLFSVEVFFGIYFVFVFFYYNVSKFYFDRIVVGMLVDVFQEFVDVVFLRMVGKFRFLDIEKVKSIVENGMFLIYL